MVNFVMRVLFRNLLTILSILWADDSVKFYHVHLIA